MSKTIKNPMSEQEEQTPYIPYKHIALITLLTLVIVSVWLYTPETDTVAESNVVEIPLAIATAEKEAALAASPSPVISSAQPESDAAVDAATKEDQGNRVASKPKAEVAVVEEVPIEENTPQTVQPETAQPLPKEVSAQTVAETTPVVENISEKTIEQPQEPVIKTENKVVIRQGDVLSLVFDRYNLGQTALRNILSADESLLALETVRPGQVLYFRYDKDTQQLKEMEFYKRLGYSVIYRRNKDGSFNYETQIKEGQWRSERISGVISGSFYLSAQRAGLTEIETANVTRIFSEQLDFARTIQKGDKFQIVRAVQYIEGQRTGQTRIESARIQRRAHEHTAFLFDDGRYYDKEGRSLARAFTRTPLKKRYRISSRFNPRRVHPVTGRVGPHNGVDFATPTGTKVVSTGDGVVSRVGNHPYAGRYIDIKHGGQYKTRYLHLHRVMVRKGQSISRGQTIALSGNTGRSTGPHLHFELHINGRPVDPMRAKIPISRTVPKKQRLAFSETVQAQTRLLDNQAQPIKVAAKEGEGATKVF